MFGWLKGKKETKSAAARTSARPSRVQTSPGHRVQSPSTSPSGVQTSPGRRIERPTPVRSPAIPEADLEQGRATLLGEVDTVIEGMPLLSGAARETYEASLDPEATRATSSSAGSWKLKGTPWAGCFMRTARTIFSNVGRTMRSELVNAVGKKPW